MQNMSQQRSASVVKLGPCLVDPDSCTIEREGEKCKVTPRSMDVLLYLAEHANRIVSSDELLDTFWGPLASDHAVHKAVAELRSALGDSVRAQRFIKTIPKRGYKLLVVPASTVEENVKSDGNLRRLLEAAASRLRYADHKVLTGGLLALCSFWALAVFAPQAEQMSEVRRSLIVAQHPFVVEAQDPGSIGPFAEALYANLITRLTAVEALRVVPMADVQPAQADSTATAAQPARASDYQVRGSLVHTQDSTSLYLNLIRTSSGIVAFSRRLQVTPSAAPETLDPLTDQLVDLISSRLLSAERGRALAARPRSSSLIPVIPAWFTAR